MNDGKKKVPFVVHIDTFGGGVNIIFSSEERRAVQMGITTEAEVISKHLFFESKPLK
jgi:hypothetical protein